MTPDEAMAEALAILQPTLKNEMDVQKLKRMNEDGMEWSVPQSVSDNIARNLVMSLYNLFEKMLEKK